MNQYTFEGRTLQSNLEPAILDRIAGLTIAYRTSVGSKELARQGAFIKGFVAGLEAAKLITREEAQEVYQFFVQSGES